MKNIDLQSLIFGKRIAGMFCGKLNTTFHCTPEIYCYFSHTLHLSKVYFTDLIHVFMADLEKQVSKIHSFTFTNS